MAITLLEVVTEVALMSNFYVPDTVTSGDPATLQMRSAVNQAIEDIVMRNDWGGLRRSHTFTTTVTTGPQPNSIPNGFRRMVGNTMYRTDNSEGLVGPVGNAIFGYEAAGNTLSSTTPYWRMSPEGIQFTKDTPIGTVISYEYISKFYSTNVGTGQPTDRLINDNDSVNLPSNLVILGALWKFKYMKGLTYDEDMINYERQLAFLSDEANGGTASISYGTPFSYLNDDNHLPWEIPVGTN